MVFKVGKGKKTRRKKQSLIGYLRTKDLDLDRTCRQLLNCPQQFGRKLTSKVVRDNLSMAAELIFARQWLALHCSIVITLNR